MHSVIFIFFLKNQLYKISGENTNETNLSKLNDPSSLYAESFSSIQTLLSTKNTEKWKIPIDNLKFGNVLGQGAFGTVIYAEFYINHNGNDRNLTTKKPVAIKKLRGI